MFGSAATFKIQVTVAFLAGRYLCGHCISLAFLPQLQYLIENEFIDSQTRALFLDTSSYNPALNIFAVVRILFEFTPAGHVTFMLPEERAMRMRER